MNRIRSFLAGFIPQYIGAGAILGFMRLFSFRIPIKTRNKHLAKNEAAWRTAKGAAMQGGFIEEQRALSGMVLGNKPADFNSCEVIAAYNALAALGREASFPELLQEFERGGLVFFGAFGTAPEKLRRFFAAQGLPATVIRGRKITEKTLRSLAEEHRVFLLTAFNDRKDILSEVHTVCLTGEEGQWYVHNGGPLGECYGSLSDAVNGMSGGRGKPIVLYALGERKERVFC